MAIISDPSAGEVILVLDALDECEQQSRKALLNSLKRLAASGSSRIGCRLKILLTSRPYYSVEKVLEQSHVTFSTFQLSGEGLNLVIAEEIAFVIKDRIGRLGPGFSDEWKKSLQQEMLSVAAPDRTFLWVYLVFEEITKLAEERAGEHEILTGAIHSVPKSVHDAYNRILCRVGVEEQDWVQKLLGMVLYSVRPSKVSELNIALHIKEGTRALHELHLPPDNQFSLRILKQCQFFLQVSDSEEVLFIHQTTREYLQSKEGAPRSTTFDTTA